MRPILLSRAHAIRPGFRPASLAEFRTPKPVGIQPVGAKSQVTDGSGAISHQLSEYDPLTATTGRGLIPPGNTCALGVPSESTRETVMSRLRLSSSRAIAAAAVVALLPAVAPFAAGAGASAPVDPGG